jgi:hypothetical protein
VGHDEDDQEALAASASDVDAVDEVDFRSPASPPRPEDFEMEEVDMSNPSPDATTTAALAATTPAALAATTSAALAATTPAAPAAHTIAASAAISPAVSAESPSSADLAGQGIPVTYGQSSRNTIVITDEELSEAALMSTEAESLVAALEAQLASAKEKMSQFVKRMELTASKEIKAISHDASELAARNNCDNLLSGGAQAKGSEAQTRANKASDRTTGFDSPIYVEDDDDFPVPITPTSGVSPKPKSAFTTPDLKRAGINSATTLPGTLGDRSPRASQLPTSAAGGGLLRAAGGGVRHTSATTGYEPKGATPAPGANEEIMIPKPQVSPSAGHDRKVGALIALGWRHNDVVTALSVTKNDKGEEDTAQAHEYLKRLSADRVKRAFDERFLKRQHHVEYDSEEAIRKGGELAVIISMLPETADFILHLQEVHRRTRGSHSDEIGRAAANLLAHEKVRQYDRLRGISALQMNKIALGVVHDCRDCEALRIKAAAAKREAEERQRQLAQQKRLEAERKEREAARLLEQRKSRAHMDDQRAAGGDTPPVTELMDDDGQPLFDLRDARWSKNKRAKLCWNCDLGERVSGELLYECDLCKHAFHSDCTKWHKVRRRNPRADPTNVKYACHSCFRMLPSEWIPAAGDKEGRNPDTTKPPSFAAPAVNTPNFRTTATPPSSAGAVRGGNNGGGYRLLGSGTPSSPNSSTITSTGEKLNFSKNIGSYKLWECGM